jgi:hypothetical protein
MGKFETGQSNPGRRFKPGQSGNPGGMPKAIVEVARAARLHTPEMLDILVSIARDKDATTSARVSAAQYVVDRAWGRPKESVTVTREGNFEELSDAELHAIARGDFGGEPVTNGSGIAAAETDDPPQSR